MMRVDNFLPRSELQPGMMIIYPFLFRWQSEQGITEAVKVRPCVVIHRVELGDDALVAILPITTTPVDDWKIRALIPDSERRHAHMRPTAMQSICLAECNLELLSTADRIHANVIDRRFTAEFTGDLSQRFLRLYNKDQVRILDRNRLATPHPAPAGPSV